MSLYLKYRPKSFSCIVGQDHIKKILKNSLRDNHVSHAYLFAGSRGTGKTSTARILAKAINCLNLKEDGEACNVCEICKTIDEGKMFDIIEIDAASNRGIDEIRELREKIKFAPTQGKSKVYIIDEVHMLTKEAFNAILKTLEEPPEHAYFILATTESHKIPETIISRCQQFRFKQFSIEEIVSRLDFICGEESISKDSGGLELIAKRAHGGLRDAISLLDQLSSKGDVIYDNVREMLGLVGDHYAAEFFDLLMEKKLQEAFESVEAINRDGYDLEQFCWEFLQFLRTKMSEFVKSNDSESLKKVVEYIELFGKAKNNIKRAIYPQLPLEVAVVKSIVGTSRDLSSKIASRDLPKIQKKEEKKTVEVKNASPKVDEVAQESKKSVVSPDSAQKEDLDINHIRAQWPRIYQNLKTALVKLSLKNAVVEKIENQHIYLAFQSKFHLKKVEENKNKNELLDAVQKTFGAGLGVECFLQEVDIDSEEAIEETLVAKGKVEDKKPEEPNIQDMIGQIFG